MDQSSNGYNYNEDNDISLAIRILFHKRDVGIVIGKGGETVINIRDQSGAKVSVSYGTFERIVTIIGTTKAICIATKLIGQKIEQFHERPKYSNWNGPKVPLTLKLIVPASQCGFIIGKGGCKIKEISKFSGAVIKVASYMLPNSTERLVSITGSTWTISNCVYYLCNVLLDFGRQRTDPLASLRALGLGTVSTGGINPAALDALAGNQLRIGNGQNRNSGDHKNQNSNTKTISMIVRNNFIGCVIGRRGSKISEIRRISGALVHIDGTHTNRKNENRLITITGNKDSISVAKHLIEICMELQKASFERKNLFFSSDDGSNSTFPINSNGGRISFFV